MIAQLKDRDIHLPRTTEYKKYPVYKDLELLKEYSIDNIKDIYTSIFTIIKELYHYYNEKQCTIQEYMNQNNKTIASFIHTLEYENIVRRELLSLYISYVEFFHSTQTKYLEKLIYRMHIFQQDISEDMVSSKNTLFGDNTKPTTAAEGDHPISVCIQTENSSSALSENIVVPQEIIQNDLLINTREGLSISTDPSELPNLYDLFNVNELYK